MSFYWMKLKPINTKTSDFEQIELQLTMLRVTSN